MKSLPPIEPDDDVLVAVDHLHTSGFADFADLLLKEHIARKEAERNLEGAIKVLSIAAAGVK